MERKVNNMAFKECSKCYKDYRYDNPECQHCRKIYLEGREDEYHLIKMCIDNVFKAIKNDEQ